MKVTKLLCVVLMFVTLHGCKVHREVQKSISRTDSTATSTKAMTQAAQLYQQYQNKKLDSSHTNRQNAYQRQTIAYQFTPDTNRAKAMGLENRLTGITVTTEQGTQATQTGSLTRQNTDLLNTAKDSIKSEEKKNTVVNKAQEERQSKTTRTGGSFPWWLIILIILIALAVWKGRPIVLFVKAVIKVIRNGMPNTPA